MLYFLYSFNQGDQKMPATTPEAIKRKIANRKSAKDIGKEKKIVELGGTPITVKYGEPLSDEERKSRTEYLYNLMYPNRHVFKSSGRTKMTEAERKGKARVAARERYKKAKEQRGELVRGKEPTGSVAIYTPWYRLWSAAKARSKNQGVPFGMTQEDVKELVIDLTHCPVLGIRLCWTNTTLLDNSPSLDKIIPELGYVKSNVAVISQRANRIKNNANAEELGKIWCWLNKQGST